MERNCDTCGHTGMSCLEEPCRSCNWRLNRWEPKESDSETTTCTPSPLDVHPDYYRKNGLECFQAIDAATDNLIGADAFDTGNAIKYLWRWKGKNGVEDLKKAITYIQRIIDREEPHAN